MLIGVEPTKQATPVQSSCLSSNQGLTALATTRYAAPMKMSF